MVVTLTIFPAQSAKQLLKCVFQISHEFCFHGFSLLIYSHIDFSPYVDFITVWLLELSNVLFTKVVRASPIDTLRVGQDRVALTPSTLLACQFDHILHQDSGTTTNMRFSTSTLLVTALGWFSAATAHTIQLKAHSRECFHETLHRDDLMTVTFQVGDREFGGSGNLEIDFWVWSSPYTYPFALNVRPR